MTTIDALTKTALNTAVDYTFIKEVIGDRYKVGFMDDEKEEEGRSDTWCSYMARMGVVTSVLS